VNILGRLSGGLLFPLLDATSSQEAGGQAEQASPDHHDQSDGLDGGLTSWGLGFRRPAESKTDRAPKTFVQAERLCTARHELKLIVPTHVDLCQQKPEPNSNVQSAEKTSSRTWRMVEAEKPRPARKRAVL